jgi:hypothetical protein
VPREDNTFTQFVRMMRKRKENMQNPWCFALDPKTLILESLQRKSTVEHQQE